MSEDLHNRLLAIGEKIKSKGWESASIDIFVSYLAMFDREPGPLDPMIHCRPSIRASTRDCFKSPDTHEFVRNAWDCKTIDDALAVLESTADAMPTMQEKAAQMEMAKAKLSDDEKRLLGVR